MVKVSVIVPCYNVEGYVERCINSLCAQRFSDIEIICIDDGSTDGTRKKLESLAGCDGRVRVVSQKNIGLYHSRLRGIELAVGEWVAFVDADDYVDPDHLQNLYDAIETDVGVVVCGLKLVKQDGETCQHFPTFGRINSIEGVRLILTQHAQRTWLSYCWNKLYRRSLLSVASLECRRINLGEDKVFNLRTFAGAGNGIIKPIQCATYNYCAREGSLTRSTSIRHVEDYFSLLMESNRFAGQFIAGDSSDRQSYELTRLEFVFDVFGRVFRSGDPAIANEFIQRLRAVDWNWRWWTAIKRPVLFMRLIKFLARLAFASRGEFPGFLK